MMAEEGQGMIEMLQVAAELAQVDESVRYRIDADWTLNRLTEIKGADPRMWKKDSEVQEQMDAEREQAQAAQQMQLLQQAGGVAKDMSMAQNNEK